MLLGLGVWQFEQRCVSQQKQLMRNLLVSGMGLVSMLVALWVLSVTVGAMLGLLLHLVARKS